MSSHSHARNLYLIFSLTLLGFGALMVQSASLTARPSHIDQIYLSKHLLFMGIGVVAGLFCSAIPARFWQKFSPWLLCLTIALLCLTLVPGFGRKVNGATRWLQLGPLNLQPAELAKLALPLFLAAVLVCSPERKLGFVGHLKMFVPLGMTLALVVIQPDLGTTLFLMTGAGLTLFVGGWPARNFAYASLLTIPALGSLFFLKPYQVRRITGFIDSWRDIEQAPYQIKQAFVSIGAGGFWGVGLGNGWQKLSYLPEANTDFVFAVVAEELGFVGALGVILLWVALFLTGSRMLKSCEQGSFARVAGTVLLAQIVLQAALNVAVVLALVPPKGIPHPLLSYGGSNLVVSLMALGMIHGFTRLREPHAETLTLSPKSDTMQETETASVSEPALSEDQQDKVA